LLSDKALNSSYGVVHFEVCNVGNIIVNLCAVGKVFGIHNHSYRSLT